MKLRSWLNRFAAYESERVTALENAEIISIHKGSEAANYPSSAKHVIEWVTVELDGKKKVVAFTDNPRTCGKFVTKAI